MRKITHIIIIAKNKNVFNLYIIKKKLINV